MSENKKNISTLTLAAAGSIVLGSMTLAAGTAEARVNDFQSLGSGAQLRSSVLNLNGIGNQNTVNEKDSAEGTCGEKSDPAPGDDKDGGEGKCGEGKCGEGKCGDAQ